MKDDILNIFYNEIVPESSKGRVDCYFMVNVLFNLVVANKPITSTETLDYDGILIPILKITDKEKFDNLLVEYTTKALNFYSDDDFSFINDEESLTNEEKRKYTIKYIISMLFANTSYIDFDNPLNFLQSRINMFDNGLLLEKNKDIDLGHLDSIGATLHVCEKASPIRAESPACLYGTLVFDDGYKLNLPQVYGAFDGKSYKVYGLQQKIKSDPNNFEQDTKHSKMIRKGLVSKVSGAPEHYFLMMMVFMALCTGEEIEAILFLLPRWNSKRIAFSRYKDNELLQQKFIEQDKIQQNMTEVFLRYFHRIMQVSEGIDLIADAFEMDDHLHIFMSENFRSNAPVFNEIYNLVKEYQNKKEFTK